MVKIQSEEELKSIVGKCKAEGWNKFSNYFPNPLAHKAWVENGDLAFLSVSETAFISHDRKTFREILFFSKSREDFEKCILAVKDKIRRPFSIEIVTKGETQPHESSSALLKRMSRTGNPPSFAISPSVSHADDNDIDYIQEIFKGHFHPVLERVPDRKELSDLAQSRSISVYKDKDGKIAGMIIYEVSKTSIHLRYWWVDPDFRNRGIGSSLLADFFEAGRGTQRQYLWVFSDNKNAIKRYRHFGFEFDGMNDEIILFE